MLVQTGLITRGTPLALCASLQRILERHSQGRPLTIGKHDDDDQPVTGMEGKTTSLRPALSFDTWLTKDRVHAF